MCYKFFLITNAMNFTGTHVATLSLETIELVNISQKKCIKYAN